MARTLEQHAEILPGYRLLEPLGRGGFGEVWKCEAPGGFFKALKIILREEQLTGDSTAFLQELQALDHIKTIRHPFLLSMDRVELVGGDLVLVMELADKSLRVLLREYQEDGAPGIPRDELLGYMIEAAEALDLMNVQHQLLHLDIKPDNLFLVCNHVKVADFGLVNRTSVCDSAEPAGITPLYAAPERFHGTVSPSCDQYSLALVYQELLTGRLPFAGADFRQLLVAHATRPPDLSPLPEADQPIIGKALAKEHTERFPSCTALVQALLAGSIAGGQALAGTASARRSGIYQVPASSGTRNIRLPGRSPASRVSLREESWEEVTTAPAVVPAPVQSGPTPREPLQGYKFLDRLGRGPSGEYWRARAPDGARRLVHLVFGYGPQSVEEEKQALQRLKALRHIGLVKTELVVDSPGRFFVLSELPESTLWDRFQKCRGDGLPGIPREELLDHLHGAAETLDDLHNDQQLFHLGLMPGCLLLIKHQLRLADFGLLHLFWARGGAPLGPLNARYAAPELFREPPRRGCDVYSLALLYQELLTGSHPLRNQAGRANSGSRRAAKLDFGNLPQADRSVLTRALDPDPRQRPESCMALVEALKGMPSAVKKLSAERPVSLPSPAGTRAEPPPASDRVPLPPAPPPLRPVLTELIAVAADGVQIRELGNLRYLLYPGKRLVYKCAATLNIDMARLKLEGFREEWKARVTGGDREEHFVLQVAGAASFWRRCLGMAPGLSVDIRLRRGVPGTTLTEVSIQIQPVGCDNGDAAELLEESGPTLLASLRTYLQPYPERRAQPRLLFEQPLEVRPVLPHQQLGEKIVGLSRDISTEGMRLWVPQPLSVPRVSIQLPLVSRPGVVQALAQIRNVQATHDGCCEIGVRFLENPG